MILCSCDGARYKSTLRWKGKEKWKRHKSNVQLGQASISNPGLLVLDQGHDLSHIKYKTEFIESKNG